MGGVRARLRPLLRGRDRLLRARFAPAADHAAARGAGSVAPVVRRRGGRGAAGAASGGGTFRRRAPNHAAGAAATTRAGIDYRELRRLSRPLLCSIEALSTSAAHVSGCLEARTAAHIRLSECPACD